MDTIVIVAFVLAGLALVMFVLNELDDRKAQRDFEEAIEEYSPEQKEKNR